MIRNDSGERCIGIDFDNTIARYDRVFERTAIDWGWLAAKDGPWNKNRVRIRVRALEDGEQKWRQLQARVYGPGMAGAELMPGLEQFFLRCRDQGMPLYIVSHKTRFASADVEHTCDLRQAALGWMETQGFFDPARFGLRRENIFFEPTRAEKINRIARLRCSHFIDDLVEIFFDPAFPDGVERFLFSPGINSGGVGPYRLFDHWERIQAAIFAE